MEKFYEALKEVRERSPYRSAADFARHTDLVPRTYSGYETGQNVPSEFVLERIINKSSVPPMIAERLRSLHRLAIAEKSGVDLSMFERIVDASDLAERIIKELEYELKRYNITITPRIRRVCNRRVSMILDNALRKT